VSAEWPGFCVRQRPQSTLKGLPYCFFHFQYADGQGCRFGEKLIKKPRLSRVADEARKRAASKHHLPCPDGSMTTPPALAISSIASTTGPGPRRRDTNCMAFPCARITYVPEKASSRRHKGSRPVNLQAQAKTSRSGSTPPTAPAHTVFPFAFE